MGGGGWILHLVFYRIPKNASTSMMNHLGNLNLIKKNEEKLVDIQIELDEIKSKI